MNTVLSAPFLNRAADFNPGDWFHLVPKGTFQIARKEADGKVKVYQQVIDDIACARMVAAFANRQAANPDHRLFIGFEHFAHNPGGSTEAACWVNALQERADGVWAKGDWTDLGETAIKNRRYRFLSPVWFPRQTEPLGGNRFRPVEVNDAGLTNMPNLGDALQPFWNRADAFHGREATTEKTNQGNTMKDRLIQLFKLPAASTEDEVFAHATAFFNRAAEAAALQGKFDTLTRDHTALQNRYNPLLAASVEATLTAHAGIIAEGSKAAWKNRLEADFDGTVELLKGIKPVEKKAPVHKPGAPSAPAASGDDKHPFLNRVQEVMTAEKLDESAAMLAVGQRDPALYAAYAGSLTAKE